MTQRKTWNVLLLNAFNDLKTKDRFEISIKELNNLLNFDTHNYQFLKNALRALNTTQVEFNILDKDKGVWEITTLLAGVRFEQGICYYAYNPLIKDRLANPDIYAKLNLTQQNKFNRKYKSFR